MEQLGKVKEELEALISSSKQSIAEKSMMIEQGQAKVQALKMQLHASSAALENLDDEEKALDFMEQETMKQLLTDLGKSETKNSQEKGDYGPCLR